jgi:hypothetical protein
MMRKAWQMLVPIPLGGHLVADIVILCLPLTLRTASGDWRTIAPESPSLAVLELVHLLGTAGHRVHPHQPSGAAEGWPRSLLASADRVDMIALPINYFSWPAALEFLRSYDHANAPPVLLAATGPCPTGIGEELARLEVVPGWLDATRDDALQHLHRAPGPPPRSTLGARLPPAEQLVDWPLWDRGLSNVDTWGFPLQRQPHPWNQPTVPASEPEVLAAWHEQIEPAVSTMREAELSLTRPPGAWDRDGMDVLGRLTMACTQRQGHPPALIARLTPDALLAHSVASSLGVLPVRQLDLIAGSCSDSTLRRAGQMYDQRSVEAAVEALDRAGLGGRTVLSIVVGLPEESLTDALHCLRSAIDLATSRQLAAVRVEWWLNLPGSPLHREAEVWESSLGALGVPAGDLRWLQQPLESTLNMEERSKLADVVEVVRLAHRTGTIVGPLLPVS